MFAREGGREAGYREYPTRKIDTSIKKSQTGEKKDFLANLGPPSKSQPKRGWEKRGGERKE